MKVTFFSILFTITLLFTAQASYAETYRWIDESGNIRIGIKPATVVKDKKADTETKKSPPGIARPASPKAVELPETPPAKTVDAPQAEKPVPAPVVATPDIIAPTKTPASTQPPKPAQKITAKKPKPAEKKAATKQPAVKKTTVRKKPEKTPPVKTAATEKESTNEHNTEMCGVFTSYVSDYEEKVRNCSPNICDIYNQALTRYKKKQASYCK